MHAHGENMEDLSPCIEDIIRRVWLLDKGKQNSRHEVRQAVDTVLRLFLPDNHPSLSDLGL
jgi:hypothetical protein